MRAALVMLASCGRLDFSPRDPDATASCGHTFCDDFERTSPVETGWSSIDTSGGTLAIEQGRLRLDLAFPSTGGAFLTRTLPAALSTIHVGFTLELAQIDTTAEVDLVQLHFVPPPQPCTSFGYYIVRDRTGPMELQETFGGCGGNTNDTFAFAAGTHRVELEAALGAIGMGHVRVTIDDTIVVDKPADHALTSLALELRLGAGAQAASGPAQIYYDDVVVDVQ